MRHEKYGGQMCMIIISPLSTTYVTPFLASLKGLNSYLLAKPTLKTTSNHCTVIGVRLGMGLPSF
jgi:hypothetical protein